VLEKAFRDVEASRFLGSRLSKGRRSKKEACSTVACRLLVVDSDLAFFLAGPLTGLLRQQSIVSAAALGTRFGLKKACSLWDRRNRRRPRDGIGARSAD
jgi:hypothetical protein